MIEFVSVSQYEIKPNDILILAEVTYDENILGSSMPWIVLPCFAKPYESTFDWDITNGKSIAEYENAITDSEAAMTYMESMVNVSNRNEHVVIGCYDFTVSKSHLSVLLDIMEDLFAEQAPELCMIGG